MVKSIFTYLNHLRFYTVFLLTFVVNATWLDIA